MPDMDELSPLTPIVGAMIFCRYDDAAYVVVKLTRFHDSELWFFDDQERDII